MVIRIKILFVACILLLTKSVHADGPNNVHLRGVVVPSNQIKISMNQVGVLNFIAPSGTVIKQGERIAEINAAELQGQFHQAKALLQSAEAELASANHNVEKTRRLVNENILSEIALTEAQFSLQTAKANLEVGRSKFQLAELALQQAVLRAPFDGVVADTTVKKGEFVVKGDPIIEFASLTEMVMSIDLPPELTESLSEGTETAVLFQGNEIGRAKVKRLFPLLQPSSGLRRVIWQVESNQSMLISGRYVELQAWF